MKTKKKYVMEKQDDKCHHLYTMWALEHINTAVDCINALNAYSNLNTLDLQMPLIEALEKKIYTNPAYKEAFDVLVKLCPEKFKFMQLDDDHENDHS